MTLRRMRDAAARYFAAAPIAVPAPVAVPAAVPAVFLASLALLGCGSKDEEPRLNVVLISIDTLRPDHLGCYGYRRNTSPNIDQLARSGAVFEQHISSAPWTLPAHTAMFTSVPDSVHGVVDPIGLRLADEFVTLPESFQSAGYRTAGFFAGPYLHPAFGLGQGFDTYEDCVNTVPDDQIDGDNQWSMRDPILRASHHGVTNDKVYARWKSFYEDAGPSAASKPFFAFVHLWDVHFDFTPPAPFDTMFDPDYDGPYTGRDFFYDPKVNAAIPDRDKEHIVALYDGEIRWTDTFIGKIRDDLASQGLLENTLIVITSDHGTELFDHGGKGHRTTLYDEQIHIPLILHLPGVVEPQRYAGQSRMIDIGPTIRDLAGLRPVAATMGETLAPIARGEITTRPDVIAVSELMSVGRNVRSIRTETGKMVINLDNSAGVWFDMVVDPSENAPKPIDTNARAESLRVLYNEAVDWITGGIKTRPAAPSDAKAPDSVMRSLDAMGYVSAGAEDDEPREAGGK